MTLMCIHYVTALIMTLMLPLVANKGANNVGASLAGAQDDNAMAGETGTRKGCPYTKVCPLVFGRKNNTYKPLQKNQRKSYKIIKNLRQKNPTQYPLRDAPYGYSGIKRL